MLWLKLLLSKLKVVKSEPMKVYYDNKEMVAIFHNPVHHDSKKHVEMDRHFIKEKIEHGTICIVYVLSSQLVTDV